MESTWKDTDKVFEYVGRVGRLAARAAGEAELVESLPECVERVLDLGCGDGRLAAVVLDARPDAVEVIGLDNSQPMIELARQRFRSDTRVAVEEHDLNETLPSLGVFDVIMAGFAIHHLSDERKQSLLGELASMLRPGGRFANLEVVRCATPELQEEFHRRIEKPCRSPG